MVREVACCVTVKWWWGGKAGAMQVVANAKNARSGRRAGGKAPHHSEEGRRTAKGEIGGCSVLL